MLNIFILEDEFLQQTRIETVIKDVIAKKSLKCKGPEIFGKPSQLLDAITERGSHQLFFLDIEIKGEEKKGLDIAKEIRKKDPNATIVFVTTHSEFMPVTFKYRVAALDFIDKALDDEDFYERVHLAIEYTMNKMGATIAQDSFTFETATAQVQVPFNNILFFETSPTIHKVILHTKEIIDQKDTQLNELSIYSHHVESLYEEIRSFRHDYINILTSLKLGIDNQDIEAIKTVYNGVLRDSANQFYDSKFDIAKLSNIKNDAIKSILSAKLLEAQNRGISISVEIEEPVSNFRIELLDFITVLSVLCDNAIEATIKATSPSMTVVFINNDDSLVLIVENSIKSEKVDVSHIFARGYSSKGEGRGLGLHNVNSILEKYPKSTITTRSANHLFSQTIRFCK